MLPQVLGVVDIRMWAPDHITRDDDSLIQQVQTKILPRRGVWASPDEIIITVGARHALYMADLLMREGTSIGIENPCYPDARNIFSSRTRRSSPLAWMAMDCLSSMPCASSSTSTSRPAISAPRASPCRWSGAKPCWRPHKSTISSSSRTTTKAKAASTNNPSRHSKAWTATTA
jgi:hypothetical protein